MNKAKKLLIFSFIMMFSFFLQGCSLEEYSIKNLTTPTTGHEIVKDKYSETKFEVQLKADMTQNYEWYVYSQKELDETGQKLRKGMFNKTYYWNYGYVARGDEEDFYLYLILVKDGDLETCKAYPYHMIMKDSKLYITEEKAFTLQNDKALNKEIAPKLELHNSY